MSDLLDRILREIRERLAASRAAVYEHDRLKAALHALETAGAPPTGAGNSRGRGQGARASKPPGKQSSAAAGKRRAAPPGRTTRSASAPVARRSRPSGAPGGGGPVDRAGRATQVRKRAPRGANREAVLRAVGERPGVTARELAAISGVRGGTLYALLRTLAQHGELGKRELPGGQTGYALAAPARPAPVPPTTPDSATPEPTAATTPTVAVDAQGDEETAASTAATQQQRDAPNEPDRTPTKAPES